MIDFFKKNFESYNSKLQTRIGDLESNQNCGVLVINTTEIAYDSELHKVHSFYQEEVKGVEEGEESSISSSSDENNVSDGNQKEEEEASSKRELKSNLQRLRNAIYVNSNSSNKKMPFGDVLYLRRFGSMSQVSLTFKELFLPNISKNLKNIGQIASDCVLLSEMIQEEFSRYQGFVVISERNLMPIIATWLSFMIENLTKPVILTGGLLNIDNPNCDILPNIIEASYFAGNFEIPELCVYNCKKLFRGNRSIITNKNKINGVGSPNYEPIGTMDIECEVNWDMILPRLRKSNLLVNKEYDTRIGLIYMTPDPNRAYIDLVFGEKQPFKIVIIEAFGAGNLPSDDTYFITKMKKAIENGLIVLFSTQCHKGNVLQLYEASASSYGIISCEDMTIFSSLIKAAFLYKKVSKKNHFFLNFQNPEFLFLSRQMKIGRVGETQMPGYNMRVNSQGELRQIEECMSSFEDKKGIKLFDEAIIPSLLDYSISHSDINILQDLIRFDDNVVSMSTEENKNVFHFLPKTLDQAITDEIFDSKILLFLTS